MKIRRKSKENRMYPKISNGFFKSYQNDSCFVRQTCQSCNLQAKIQRCKNANALILIEFHRDLVKTN